MKILSVDIGTGTQDILLFDSQVDVENSYKLILPSPTLMVRRKLHQAARAKKDVLLSGVIMGGGPSGWGVSDHIQKGLKYLPLVKPLLLLTMIWQQFKPAV